MKEQDRTDEIRATGTAAEAGTPQARDKKSPNSPVESDTEGQGGKVFGIDPSGAESDADR